MKHDVKISSLFPYHKALRSHSHPQNTHQHFTAYKLNVRNVYIVRVFKKGDKYTYQISIVVLFSFLDLHEL